MFENKEELAEAMLNGRVFDINGWICKFDPSCITGGSDGSPFVCLPKNSTVYRPMGELWDKYRYMLEVFPELPALKTNADVMVKDSLDADWIPAHFEGWCNDNWTSWISCFAANNSHRDNTITDVWKYWKITKGEHKGRTNIVKGVNNYA